MNRQVYIAPHTDRIQVAMEQGFMVTSGEDAKVELPDDQETTVEEYDSFENQVTFY